MRKESISEMIDKRISESLSSGYSFDWIKQDLQSRIDKMVAFIHDQKIDIETVIGLDLDILTGSDFTDEKISVTRVKYTIFYIKHSNKRLKQLNWVESKIKEFPNLTRSQIFKMIKLKEKLSEDNALPF
jgi:hypothetical protein